MKPERNEGHVMTMQGQDLDQNNTSDDSDADAFAILGVLVLLFFGVSFYLNS